MERNVIIATAPSTHPRFGGIRVRDGRGILVANNRVIGPWTNAISATDVIEAVIEQNDLEATQFAIAFGLNRVEPALLISVSNTVVRNNRIEGAGTAGVFVFEACYNTLFGNAFKLDRNVDGVAFAPSSGGNTYVGNKNIVVDAGDRDCDLEGNIDPNVLTGAGQGRSGPLGFTVRHAAHLSNDIR